MSFKDFVNSTCNIADRVAKQAYALACVPGLVDWLFPKPKPVTGPEKWRRLRLYLSPLVRCRVLHKIILR